MDSQIITEQIIRNNDYSLQLCSKGTTLTLKLMIKVSKIRADVYHKILNSLKDDEKLQQNFDSMSDFIEYIKDVSNVDVVLETKTVRVLTTTKMKKTIQIASIPLMFLNSIETNPDDDIVQQILERCSQKKELSVQQVKLFLGNIAIYLSEQKKQYKNIKQQQDHQIRNLKNQIEAKWTQCHEEKQKCFRLINNMDEKLEKCQQKQVKIENQLDRLEEEKLDKSQIGQIRVENERINKQVELMKKKMEKDINVLGVRLERVQKLMEKKQFNEKISEAKMEEKIQYSEKKEKMEKKVEARNWVDPNSNYFSSLVFSESSITAKSSAWVFGKNRIMGQYHFTATFFKFGSAVVLGVIDTLNKYRTSWNTNFVSYQNNSYSCVGCSGGSKKGGGFKTGEKVTVAIDLKQGLIQWRVGSQIRCQETVEMLKDYRITWVPFIGLYSKDDSVEISEE